MKKIFVSFFLISACLFIIPGNISKKIFAQADDANIAVLNPDKIFSAMPKTFIRDILGRDRLSPGGKYVAGKAEGDIFVFDMVNMSSVYIREKTGLEWINDFEWVTPQKLLLKGLSGGTLKAVTYDISTGLTADASVAPGAPGQETDVQVYSYFDAEKNTGGIYLKEKGKELPELIVPGIFPVSISLSGDNKSVAYLYLKNNSSLCLSLYSVENKTARDLATDLDGSLKTEIAFDPGGRNILLSLITDKLDYVKKFQPLADRDLDIYMVNVATGAIIPVIIEEGDDILIGLDGNNLIWNKNLPMVRTCVIPADGSKVMPLVQGQTFLSSWNGKGDQLAVVYGDWRNSDIPLNWDIGVFGVDKTGKMTGELKPAIQEAFEEYGPAWSPDGSWLLYYTRKTESPFPTIMSLDITEDLYIKNMEGAVTSRITDMFIEIADVCWSADGKKIFISATKKGEQVSKAYVITLAEDKTSAVSVEPLGLDGINASVLTITGSPDGKSLAFETGDGSKARKIWISTTEGKEVKELVSYESLTVSSGLDFSGDGSSIIYAAFDGKHHQLYRVKKSGGNPEKVTDNAYDIIYPDVSPDGEWIAATLFRHIHELWMGEIVYE